MKIHKMAVGLLFGINGFLFTNYISRLPRIQAYYDLDNGAIGMVLLASAIGALIAMPLTSWLISARGSRQVASLSGLLFCLLIPFIALMPGGGALGAFFFLLGLATGSMDVSMNAQAVAVEKAGGKPIMSSLHAIFSAGMMLGAGSGALFTHLETGLAVHLSVVSMLGLGLMIWAVTHLYDDPKPAKAREKKGLRLPQGSLIGLGLIAFCCMLGEGAMANWSTNYLLSVASAESTIAPLGLAVFSLAMMMARFWGDKVRLRLGDRQLLILSSIVAAAGLALLLLVPHPFVVLLGFLLVGLGLSVVVPIAYSTAGNTPGMAPGVGIGMVTTIGYGGLLLGPPMIGFLADWQSLRFAMGTILILFGLMILLSFRMRVAAQTID
jgi:predicted MFS family arabinose efflux permease